MGDIRRFEAKRDKYISILLCFFQYHVPPSIHFDILLVALGYFNMKKKHNVVI